MIQIKPSIEARNLKNLVRRLEMFFDKGDGKNYYPSRKYNQKKLRIDKDIMKNLEKKVF